MPVLALFLGAFGAGCGKSDNSTAKTNDAKQESAPPKTEIDRAVNWSLANHLTVYNGVRTYSRTNYFESYTISNTYTETKDGWTSFIYDYVAQVPVEAAGREGNTPFWGPDKYGKYPFASDEASSTDIKLITFNFSVTLTKKGNTWYCSNTER